MLALLERHRTAVLVTAIVAPLLVCAVLVPFRSSITMATAVLVLVLVVVAAASTGSRFAGIAAAVSGGIWFDFLLTEPYGRLAIDDPNDIEAAVLLVLIGAAVTEVAMWGHRQQARAARRSGYLDGVLSTAEIVAVRGETPEALADQVAHQIQELLDVAECQYVPGPVRDPRTAILDHQGLVYLHGRPVNVDRDGLPTDAETALVLAQGSVAVGHFLLTAAADIVRPTLEQRRVAVLLADQLGTVHVNPAG